MKKLFIAALAIFGLPGCVMNGIPTPSTEDTAQTRSVEKVFTGVPVLLSMEGSVARLDDEWMVTAAHNKPIFQLTGRTEVIYHPSCDIAVYRDNGVSETKVGTALIGEEVDHIGYPVGMPQATTTGVVIGDVNVPNYDCVFTATDAAMMSGMSGGGVYNKAGELVGINQGIMFSELEWLDGRTADNTAIFVSLLTVRDWLIEVTGNDYFNGRQEE